MVHATEDCSVVAEAKDDRRLQRRQQTRGVHRKRKAKVSFLDQRVKVLSSRARRARKNGHPEAVVISSEAKAARRKKERLERRFHVRVTSQSDSGNGSSNGEE